MGLGQGSTQRSSPDVRGSPTNITSKFALKPPAKKAKSEVEEKPPRDGSSRMDPVNCGNALEGEGVEVHVPPERYVGNQIQEEGAGASSLLIASTQDPTNQGQGASWRGLTRGKAETFQLGAFRRTPEASLGPNRWHGVRLWCRSQRSCQAWPGKASKPELRMPSSASEEKPKAAVVAAVQRPDSLEFLPGLGYADSTKALARC